MKPLIYVLSVGVLFSLGAHAEDPPANKWKSDAELGVIINNGNTRAQNVNAKLGVLNERTQWRHDLRLEALNTSDKGTTTAEKYFAAGKTDYKMSTVDYLFAIVSYEEDRFGGYDYQATEALGYGRRVINGDARTLDLEAGPGLHQAKIENGDTQNDGILRAAANLNWKLSPTALFTELLSTEIGEDVTVTKSITELKAQVAGNLAMKLSFTVKNTSDVPPGIKETDTQTAVTMVYNLL